MLPLTAAGPMPLVEQDNLGVLAAAWDELAACSPLPSPFLRSWWLEHIAGGEARFALVRSGADLLGGLAIARRVRLGVDCIRLLGNGRLCADHLDLVCAPGAEATVQDTLSEWLSRPGSRFLEFDGVADGARLDTVLSRVRSPRWVGSSTAPWAALTGDFDDFMSSRPSRLRNSVKQSSSRLKRLRVRYHVARPRERADAIECLRRLHISSWGRRSDFLPVFPLFAQAADAGMACQELAIHQLVSGSEVIASQAWFEVGKRASFYQSGRNSTDPRWRGAGNVLTAFIVQRAFELGFSELDFLRGDEPYKLEWASHSRNLVRYLGAKGPQARLRLFARKVESQLVGTLSSRPASWEPAGSLRSPPPDLS